jgi:hypothetical protein
MSFSIVMKHDSCSLCIVRLALHMENVEIMVTQCQV